MHSDKYKHVSATTERQVESSSHPLLGRYSHLIAGCLPHCPQSSPIIQTVHSPCVEHAARGDTPMQINLHHGANQFGYQSAVAPGRPKPCLMNCNEYELPVPENGCACC